MSVASNLQLDGSSHRDPGMFPQTYRSEIHFQGSLVDWASLDSIYNQSQVFWEKSRPNISVVKRVMEREHPDE